MEVGIPPKDAGLAQQPHPPPQFPLHWLFFGPVSDQALSEAPRSVLRWLEN